MGASAGRFAGTVLTLAALCCSSSAGAKEFEPGDLRICNAERCVPITDQDVLSAFSSFYYLGPRPAIAASVRTGAPAFVLRFDNAFAAGVVGGARLDRTLVYGINCGRFRRGTWYRLPLTVATDLRRLVGLVEPPYGTDLARLRREILYLHARASTASMKRSSPLEPLRVTSAAVRHRSC
jgi:hypothetical protein